MPTSWYGAWHSIETCTFRSGLPHSLTRLVHQCLKWGWELCSWPCWAAPLGHIIRPPYLLKKPVVCGVGVRVGGWGFKLGEGQQKHVGK
jgi:hypothetical protein